MNVSSDVLIIGGGVMGLAIAIELKLRGASVTVLSRDFHAAASLAAAGMLAPQAEAIPPSPMLELCLRSRSLYPEWTRKLEELSGEPTGYWPCGILAPVYENQGSGIRDQGSGEFAIAPSCDISSLDCPAEWLDRDAINLYQPGLSSDVVGGWWYPEDGQVDNRALLRALWTAAESLGVDLRDGVTVEGIQQQQRQVIGVQTSAGVSRAEHYVLATGAWSNELLPIPVSPRKGQMLSVRVPDFNNSVPLQRVLFGSDIYIVPRRDSRSETLRERRIVIGATSEEVGFTPHNTPAGIQALLQRAIRLYPQLQHYPIHEFWWGFRPATPDELPILGSSPCKNLTLATGHYRNGILLAPVTAALIADLIWEQKSDALLDHFHYSRFYRTRVRTIPISPLPAPPLLCSDSSPLT
jgi:thiazole synthase